MEAEIPVFDPEESWEPHWVILDFAVPTTRLRDPEDNGSEAEQVPNIVTMRHKRMPAGHTVFVVHPATWATITDQLRQTLEPYELRPIDLIRN